MRAARIMRYLRDIKDVLDPVLSVQHLPKSGTHHARSSVTNAILRQQ
jgi:hypothetical protein